MSSAEIFLACALAVAPVSFPKSPCKNGFTPADAAFIEMFRSFAGSSHVVFLSDGIDFFDLSSAMHRMLPGGILFIELDGHDGWRRYLKDSHFELFPLYWREFSIWRKPHVKIGASA